MSKGEVKGWATKEVMEDAIQIKAICFPLFDILKAVGNPIVDYFSLDIEGVELDVLKTIPWKDVNIMVSFYVFSLLVWFLTFKPEHF